MLHSFQNLLDLPSTFSLLEYPSLVPDIPSAVCGRSLVLLPKDISAQIGQNKVQIWHIMARGDLQRASFERKWEFSTFGFDTDVILGRSSKNMSFKRKAVFKISFEHAVYFCWKIMFDISALWAMRKKASMLFIVKHKRAEQWTHSARKCHSKFLVSNNFPQEQHLPQKLYFFQYW